MVNQYPQLAVDLAPGETAIRDGGFLPDLGDPTGTPTSETRAMTPATARLRRPIWRCVTRPAPGFRACTDPDHTRVCPVGAQLETNAQILTRERRPRAVFGSSSISPRGRAWCTGPVANPATPVVTPVPTGMTGTAPDGGRWIEYRLAAPLPGGRGAVAHDRLGHHSPDRHRQRPMPPATSAAGSPPGHHRPRRHRPGLDTRLRPLGPPGPWPQCELAGRQGRGCRRQRGMERLGLMVSTPSLTRRMP